MDMGDERSEVPRKEAHPAYLYDGNIDHSSRVPSNVPKPNEREKSKYDEEEMESNPERDT